MFVELLELFELVELFGFIELVVFVVFFELLVSFCVVFFYPGFVFSGSYGVYPVEV